MNQAAKIITKITKDDSKIAKLLIFELNTPYE